MNAGGHRTEPGDVALIEASLLAVAEANIDIRHDLFARFLDHFPERRAVFLNLDAASRRMTDETLQILLGIAQGEGWVWPLVAELVVTHRNYGALKSHEYDSFIDMTVDELRKAAGKMWTNAHAAAWDRQSGALKIMVRRADSAWDRALAGGVAAG